MRKDNMLIVVGVVSVVLIILATSFENLTTPNGKIEYPYGYRKWTHIKTAIVGPNSPAFKKMGGFHHIYANEKAMEGYKTGNFPEGSIIVFDVIEAVTEPNSDIIPGKRRLIDVMVKNEVLYSGTGGWGYGEFVEGDKTDILTEKVRMQCYTCHKPQTDAVFSEFIDASQQ